MEEKITSLDRQGIEHRINEVVIGLIREYFSKPDGVEIALSDTSVYTDPQRQKEYQDYNIRIIRRETKDGVVVEEIEDLIKIRLEGHSNERGFNFDSMTLCFLPRGVHYYYINDVIINRPMLESVGEEGIPNLILTKIIELIASTMFRMHGLNSFEETREFYLSQFPEINVRVGELEAQIKAEKAGREEERREEERREEERREEERREEEPEERRKEQVGNLPDEKIIYDKTLNLSDLIGRTSSRFTSHLLRLLHKKVEDLGIINSVTIAFQKKIIRNKGTTRQIETYEIHGLPRGVVVSVEETYDMDPTSLTLTGVEVKINGKIILTTNPATGDYKEESIQEVIFAIFGGKQ